MRTLLFCLAWCFIATCYALKIIALESPVIDAAPYLNVSPQVQEPSVQSSTLASFPYPVTSSLKPGFVSTFAIKNNGLSRPFFVIGDDAFSRAWLKKNASKLQKIHALGLATQVATQQALNELIEMAGLPLQPMNADELAAVLKVAHYPFVYEEWAVWQ